MLTAGNSNCRRAQVSKPRSWTGPHGVVVGSKAFVAALSALATGDKAPQQAVHLRNRVLAWTALQTAVVSATYRPPRWQPSHPPVQDRQSRRTSSPPGAHLNSSTEGEAAELERLVGQGCEWIHERD